MKNYRSYVLPGIPGYDALRRSEKRTLSVPRDVATQNIATSLEAVQRRTYQNLGQIRGNLQKRDNEPNYGKPKNKTIGGSLSWQRIAQKNKKVSLRRERR
jgi:hypothetical protein